ncbi:MAG TPA: bifunctional hydroxymethylpyrimidine kinase/phosphomethylpyrimidine kinase [Acidimicrobiales bacterium]|nr:bifunctional hydroxymethylpyrimidine kinase/phosphomethylpyrimidine kinase [Acidimicrobiales bacterium]
MPDRDTPPTALTIAGSDSGGGAGAQADLKTFAAHLVHGTSALTAVTAQNTAEVRGVVALDPAFVREQVEAVLDDFAVRSVKTGMLANAAIVCEVARLADEGRLPQLVVDPVLVSSTGHRLLEPDGVDAYLTKLLPCALVATPNLREAAVLGGTEVEALGPLEARVAVAEEIRTTGVRYVVVKGGHLTDSAEDVVAGPEGVLVLPGMRVQTRNDHGTGCSLSAAVAANLARGADVLDAVRAAKAFVARALAGGAGWRLGAGHGPLDHFGWSDRP